MTISHSDYVAKCRRKYRRIDHGYDEALRLHLLGSERAAARKAAGGPKGKRGKKGSK